MSPERLPCHQSAFCVTRAPFVSPRRLVIYRKQNMNSWKYCIYNCFVILGTCGFANHSPKALSKFKIEKTIICETCISITFTSLLILRSSTPTRNFRNETRTHVGPKAPEHYTYNGFAHSVLFVSFNLGPPFYKTIWILIERSCHQGAFWWPGFKKPRV